MVVEWPVQCVTATLLVRVIQDKIQWLDDTAYVKWNVGNKLSGIQNLLHSILFWKLAIPLGSPGFLPA